ncbi:MAG: recombination mediator RecR [Treponemataceae bacterium]|jgi:recombination protein RecR|nr:recombination mediator RecR [Treponemataceae bacterium]
MNALEELAESFSRLPGIGKKSALRIAYHLLKTDESFLHQFARELSTLHERIKQCSVCGTYTESDPCPICTSAKRDRSMICVVEQPQDVTTIEASKEYHGLFHVLGGVISPLDGIGPEQLSIGKLVERVQKENVQEVIIATNPTIDGDVTALYIQRALNGTNVKISRLASGLPVGGDLEYADKLTLARSFSKRQSL